MVREGSCWVNEKGYAYSAKCKHVRPFRIAAHRERRAKESQQGLPDYVLVCGAVSEVSCAASVVSHDVAIPKEFVLVGCEAIQPHGASCMKFACADTQFGPKPITETIRESR